VERSRLELQWDYSPSCVVFGDSETMIRYLRSALPAMFARGSDEIAHPILVNSIPKAGTNLLLNIVLAIPNTNHLSDVGAAMACHDPQERLELVQKGVSQLEPGSVCTGHIPHTDAIACWLAEKRVKQVFIYRDPRDISVSLYHYIVREAEPRHAYYPLYERLSSDERLMAAIKGLGEGRFKHRLSKTSNLNIRINCGIFSPWLHDANTFAVRYEDLISTNRTTSLRTVRGMLRFLGLKVSSSMVSSIFDTGRDPGKSRTYRRGKPGAWKSEYSAEHIAAFREVAGDLLEQFGYAWD
jgi:hypothetical protein